MWCKPNPCLKFSVIFTKLIVKQYYYFIFNFKQSQSQNLIAKLRINVLFTCVLVGKTPVFLNKNNPHRTQNKTKKRNEISLYCNLSDERQSLFVT